MSNCNISYTYSERKGIKDLVTTLKGEARQAVVIGFNPPNEMDFKIEMDFEPGN